MWNFYWTKTGLLVCKKEAHLSYLHISSKMSLPALTGDKKKQKKKTCSDFSMEREVMHHLFKKK